MHLDPALPTIVAVLLAVLLCAIALKAIRQPYVVAYIIAGVVLGPHGLSVITEREVVDHLGVYGVTFLLFFLGMEMSPRQLMKNWRVPVVGTFLQVAASVGLVSLVGWYDAWPLGRTVLVGFVISLSSTAVVLKVLEDRGETDSPTGINVIGVLLVQDVLVVPMLIVLGFFGAESPGAELLIKQGLGAVVVTGIVGLILYRETWRLPFAEKIREDNELQVFVALSICLLFALLTGLFELSSALGAFLGGMVVGALKETRWVHHSLHSFRVVFVSLFFLSVGLLLDLHFVAENMDVLGALVVVTVLVNTLVNAGIFVVLGQPWRSSVYGGALLSQNGEFGFVLVALGLSAGVVTDFAYHVVLSVICLSLMVGPFWIGLVRMLVRRVDGVARQAEVQPDHAN